MDIKHDNIVYVRDISQIGGVETYVYEIVKKYQDLNIAVVYKTAHFKQLERIKKYCRTYKHTNEKIICKVAIINYDVSIIDYISEDAEIYQTIHADYENSAYTWNPPKHQRIKGYIGITKHICESFERITGNKNIILSYNPLTIKNEKVLILVSATRLSKIKGKDRMIRLANALTNAGINYIWYIFTNDTNEINNPNVIYMKPRLDVSKWISQADYLVQLSDTEACSYSINEALYRNIPVIVTPLPYLEEIGVKDNINSYILKFDCSNINEIVKKIRNVPSFNFNHLEDNYKNILAKSQSSYKEELKMKFLVQATDKYERTNTNDIELTTLHGTRYVPKTGEQWEVDFARKETLVELGFVTVKKEIKEEIETAVKETNAETAVKKTRKKSK